MELKKNLEIDNTKLKDTSANLKVIITQHEVKYAESETKRKAQDEDIIRLQVVNNDLEEKLGNETKTLTELTMQLKELEKKSIAEKLNYEADKEHFALVKQEIEYLVINQLCYLVETIWR